MVLTMGVILFTGGSVFPQCHGERRPLYRQTPIFSDNMGYGKQVDGTQKNNQIASINVPT